MVEILLGIDYGTKRIGLAKTDGLGMFAHGVGYLENTDMGKTLQLIKGQCEVLGVSRIVVGLPKNLDGSLGASAAAVMGFVENLKTSLPMKVVTWDERLTTKGAASYMRDAHFKSQKKKREKIDQLAAQIMLQSYLDAHGRNSNV